MISSGIYIIILILYTYYYKFLRFDLSTNKWIQLTPINFQTVLNTANSVGSNFMLTSWGVIRYGGYYRLPNLPLQYKQYVSDAFLLGLNHDYTIINY